MTIFTILLLTNLLLTGAADSSTQAYGNLPADNSPHHGGNSPPRKFEMHLVTISSIDTYIKGDSGYYNLDTGRAEIETRFISGFGPKLDGTARKRVRELVPDRASGEYFRQQLVKKGTSFFLISQCDISEEGTTVKFDYESEVEFVEGNWKAYEAGKDVSLQHTKAGAKAAQQILEQEIATISDVLVAGFKERLRQDFAQKFNVPKDSISLSDLDKLVSISVDVKTEIVAGPPSTIRINQSNLIQRSTGSTMIKMLLTLHVTEK